MSLSCSFVIEVVPQWRIQGGAPGTRPLGVLIISFLIHKFYENLAVSEVGAPLTRLAPPTGNPGSATVPIRIP